MANSLKARMRYNGGADQVERIKLNKLRSLRAALKNDYNSREIKTDKFDSYRCLINSDRLKSDYDMKVLSVEFDSGLSAGDVFKVLDDGSHWMVYLPQLTEVAYLRSDIVRCRYTLEVDGITYWIYLQGATETDISWRRNNGVDMNELNVSGTIYIKKDEHTEKFFKRFTKIKAADTTWEVEVVDKITVPGIIELEIQEYFENSDEELPEIKPGGNDTIVGATELTAGEKYGYEILPAYFSSDDSWTVDAAKASIVRISNDGTMCEIQVSEKAVGELVVSHGDYSLTCQILAAQEETISGPDELYPYDEADYVSSIGGTFSIAPIKVAKIAKSTSTSCHIEVVTGKKGACVLTLTTEGGTVYTKEITILSL